MSVNYSTLLQNLMGDYISIALQNDFVATTAVARVDAGLYSH